MADEKHVVTFAATQQEFSNLKRIMAFYKRKTYSDAIRFLIETASEKILPENNAVPLK